MRRFVYPLIFGIAIILVGLILSYNFYVGYLYLTQSPGDLGGDGPDYIQIAASISKTGHFGHLSRGVNSILRELNQGVFLTNTHEFLGHHTWRPPIWPFFLAIIFSVFKYGLFAAHIFKFLIIILGGMLFYKTLKKIDLPHYLSLLGAFAYLIHPALQIYSRTFLSEPFTLFMMTLVLYTYVVYWQNKKTLTLIVLGVTSGLLVLTHPFYVFLPPLLIFIQWLYQRLPFRNLIIGALSFVMVVSFWLTRNYMLYDQSGVFLTTSSGAVMAKGWNKDVLDLHNNVDGDLADEGLVLLPEDKEIFWSGNELERSQLYQKRTFEFIEGHQSLIFPIIVKKLKSAFNPFREKPKPGVLQTLNEVHRVLALICLALVLLFSKNKLIKTLGWTIVGATIFITVLTYSGLRFRTGQVPIELLLIFWSIDFVYKRFKPAPQNAPLPDRVGKK